MVQKWPFKARFSHLRLADTELAAARSYRQIEGVPSIKGNSNGGKTSLLAASNQNLLGREFSRVHRERPCRSKGLAATAMIIFYFLILGQICIL